MADASLVIGAGGYVGRNLLNALRAGGVEAVAAVRTPNPVLGEQIGLGSASELDRALESGRFAQIVHLPQLTRDGVDWMLDRVDGPRWVVLSSAQVTSSVQAPGTQVALAREANVIRRGGVVLRPTMVFGRGGDQNLSRTIRSLARWRLPVIVGSGEQVVDPVHVDDLGDLLLGLMSAGAEAGVYGLSGGCPTPLREVIGTLCEIVGVRTRPVRVPLKTLAVAARVAPMLRLRPDQIRRLTEDKVIDDTAARVRLGWDPAPLLHRIEQAVGEAKIG